MSEQVIKLLITGTLDTLQMTVISTIMAMIIGIPLGVVLVDPLEAWHQSLNTYPDYEGNLLSL